NCSQGLQKGFTCYNFAVMKPIFNSSFDKAQKPLESDYPEVDVLTDLEAPYSLIVWNDEVNTFEWVIETLMEVCGHSAEQAEQCAYIIHYNGKYAVKNGSYDELKPDCDAITDRGIGATIEITV
ncbi:MAG TPA: ATP-dependent Clp protease adaptor ClpS, partial [Chitinophagaceae bacterium]|nr:ATP-dependent Clp protease adaptor ClpS [Chitinophagaceae bacterium]